jgi:hypothetical protein
MQLMNCSANPESNHEDIIAAASQQPTKPILVRNKRRLRKKFKHKNPCHQIKIFLGEI